MSKLFLLALVALFATTVVSVHGLDLDSSFDSAVDLPTMPSLSSVTEFTAIESTTGDFLQAIQLKAEELRQAAFETIAKAIGQEASIQPAFVDDDEKCRNCTADGAHHILDSAYTMVTDACANVTCPFIQKRCDWIAANEKEFKGYLAAELRPGGLGFAYCLGTGDCQKSASLLTAPVDEAVDAGWPVRVGTMVDSFVSDVKSDRERNMEGDILPLEIDISDEHAGLLGRKKHHHCLGKATSYIFHHALHHIKKVCESSEDPEIKKACDWMENNKEVTRGYVYGKMQPWKFAIGYCAHERRCSEVKTE